jgi:UDP-N-acetylglucosamine--N-acetylmuramyl-(pentapeptide) pyrophosphoryl-undecaprenol N-acetylglucosamine transferase
MKPKTIMLVGGGSGGHLTPIVAVAESLKRHNQNCKIIHVGQKGEGLSDVTDNKSIDESYSISAGKFRRYHGESFLSHLLDVKTMILNIRDVFRLVIGTFEAWRLLKKTKPDSIFLKGGFVSVPVGYAARIRKIPYITHDSDAVPGLANRLTAKNAVFNTTALPADLYNYEKSKTIQVGIPLRKEFQKVNESEKNKYRTELNIDNESKIILSVGGGLGARKINHALALASKKILQNNEKSIIVHLTGKKLYGETKMMYGENLSESELLRVMLIDFTNDIYKYSAAADIVITRAGATNIAEFAAQAKPCIVIPAPHLTGGQQIENAKVLQQASAAVVLSEDNLDSLETVVTELLKSDRKNEVADNINNLAVYDSADKIAQILLNIIK